MGILTPDYELISKVSAIVDEVNELYSKELEMNNDIDDIYSLAEMLNIRCNRLPVEWEADDQEREHPGEWMTAMAGFKETKNHIWIILWERNLAGSWGPKTFKERVETMLGHETIHHAQYNKIGYEKVLSLESGHQAGQKLLDMGGTGVDYMQRYLSDPHELMAYGHDLAVDFKYTEHPEKALRSPETHIEELSVYKHYRRFFEPDSKQIKRLLSYAARYTYV
jgi:hypothetical protein